MILASLLLSLSLSYSIFPSFFAFIPLLSSSWRPIPKTNKMQSFLIIIIACDWFLCSLSTHFKFCCLVVQNCQVYRLMWEEQLFIEWKPQEPWRTERVVSRAKRVCQLRIGWLLGGRGVRLTNNYFKVGLTAAWIGAYRRAATFLTVQRPYRLEFDAFIYTKRCLDWLFDGVNLDLENRVVTKVPSPPSPRLSQKLSSCLFFHRVTILAGEAGDQRAELL